MIQTVNFASNKLPAGKSRTLILKTILALASAVAIGVFAPTALAQPGSGPSGNRPMGKRPTGPSLFENKSPEVVVEPSSDIAQAREKAIAAKLKFDTVKELSHLGSASKKQLRLAELVKRLALLKLSNLESPDLMQHNSELRAQLIFNYRNKELEVIQHLLERGAASKLECLRAKTDRDVALARLKALQSVSDTQRKLHMISAASSKYEAAAQEHQLADKLLQSGSISQAAMDRATGNLEAAKFELAEAKRSLGARAYPVQQ